MKKTIVASVLMLLVAHSGECQRKMILNKAVCGFGRMPESNELYTWEEDNSVKEYVKKICDVITITPNFIVMRANVPDAIAMIDSNIRYIFYSGIFFNSLNSEALKMVVLAHEIGHHVNYHLLTKSSRRPLDELEADKFAGSIMAKLGIPFTTAKEVFEKQCSTRGDEYYPPLSARLEQFFNGYQSSGVAVRLVSVNDGKPEQVHEMDLISRDSDPFGLLINCTGKLEVYADSIVYVMEKAEVTLNNRYANKYSQRYLQSINIGVRKFVDNSPNWNIINNSRSFIAGQIIDADHPYKANGLRFTMKRPKDIDLTRSNITITLTVGESKTSGLGFMYYHSDRSVLE